MFVPVHPAAKPELDRVIEAEMLFDWNPLLQDALVNTETMHLKAQYNPQIKISPLHGEDSPFCSTI